MTEPLSTDQIFIRKLTDIILANLENEDFGVNELALKSGINRKVLSRKLKKISGKTVSQFIRETRLRKALEMLREGLCTVSEVGYKVGFSSPVYFTRCFHQYFGFPPGKVKKGELPEAKLKDLISDPSQEIAIVKTRQILFGRVAGISFLVLVLASVGYFIYSKAYKTDRTDNLPATGSSISIAILPFQNLTKDTLWNIWQSGIQDRIISYLTNNTAIKVRSQETINKLLQSKGQSGDFASVNPALIRNVTRKVDADLYINGSIWQADSLLNISARLINTRTTEAIKSFSLEGHFMEKDIYRIIDTLSLRLMNFLIISELANQKPLFYAKPIDIRSLRPRSAEVLRYRYHGDQAHRREDNAIAISWYLKALAIDSNDFASMIGLSSVYGNSGRFEEDYKWVLKYYNRRYQWPLENQLQACWAYAYSFEPWEEAIKYMRQLEDLYGDHRMSYLIGHCYTKLGQYTKAIPEYENYLILSRRLGKEFLENNWAYPHLVEAYNKTDQLSKERKLIREWEKNNRDNYYIIGRKGVLAFAEKDSARAESYIKKYRAALKEKASVAEDSILNEVGTVYLDAGVMDKAEVYFRKALAMDPGNPTRMHRLANFLIDSNRSLEDVQGLMDKAMALARDRIYYYNYMDTKGWGLYKQSKYREALVILQRAWDEAPFKLYAIKAHLEEVKKAVN
jgi:AraC-like DNA-binding protein/tetratricopeptide (TPR) repeat protein